jgi:4-hydroxyproline epimerase
MGTLHELVEAMAGPGELMRVIDSHTEGEPTRVVISGGPELGGGPLRERVRRFRETADAFRRMVILEPRGSEAVVGALLCEPEDATCAAGVIFFNNAGYLGMCGHGTIGVAVTLAHLGRIGLGTHRLETPVGVVVVNLIDSNQAAIENVPSFRYRAKASLEVESLGTVVGDIAWGGNWFFLVEQSPVPLTSGNIRQLTEAADRVRGELRRRGITGSAGEEIDHIEFFGPPHSVDAHSRNFVYCPGGAYDRSPCGTGTSAKLACLAADGKLRPGEVWVQESIIGSRFTASYRETAKIGIIPTITGHAYICAEALLIQQPGDPFGHGIPNRVTE